MNLTYAAIVSSQGLTRMSEEPKLFQHLTALYNVLANESANDVWTGSQRKAFDKLGLSLAMNPILYRALREMECIELVERGAGRRPTILKLVRPPQIERFVEWNRSQQTQIAIIAGGSIAYWATRPIAAARPPAVTTFLFRLRVLI